MYHIWYNDLPSDAPLRQEMIDEARIRYRAILETLADGKRFDLTSDEQRVWELFKGSSILWPSGCHEHYAVSRGMRSRFAEGLVRSWSYLPEMEQIFAEVGVPLSLCRTLSRRLKIAPCQKWGGRYVADHASDRPALPACQ